MIDLFSWESVRPSCIYQINKARKNLKMQIYYQGQGGAGLLYSETLNRIQSDFQTCPIKGY